MTRVSGRSYSYQGQDRFVVAALGAMHDGFFLDSGASDGRTGSNSLLLESEYGWTGICIEPNAEMFAELVRHRSCICLDCCLYDREAEVDFLEVARVYGGIIAEYDPAFERFARSMVPAGVAAPGEALPVRRRTTRTVASVLAEHRAPRVIDYWSLDTEGSELAILRSFPFDRHIVRAMTVEHNYSPSRRRIHDFLTGRGYRWAGTLGIDDCYLWGGGRTPDSWRSAAWSRTRRG